VLLPSPKDYSHILQPTLTADLLESGTCRSIVSEKRTSYKSALIPGAFSFLWPNETLNFYDSFNGQTGWDTLRKAGSSSEGRAGWNDGSQCEDRQTESVFPLPQEGLQPNCAVVGLLGNAEVLSESSQWLEIVDGTSGGRLDQPSATLVAGKQSLYWAAVLAPSCPWQQHQASVSQQHGGAAPKARSQLSKASRSAPRPCPTATSPRCLGEGGSQAPRAPGGFLVAFKWSLPYKTLFKVKIWCWLKVLSIELCSICLLLYICL